jgi:hypothetical protein
MIKVYNRTNETHIGPNNYQIFRGGDTSILSNPYTEIKDRTTKALYIVKDREEAIERYSQYFDMMYNGNISFKNIVDEIYEKYINGEDIYFECYCKPKRCHGDVIAEKIQKRFIKEKFKAFR